MNTNFGAQYDTNSHRLVFKDIQDTPNDPKQKAGINCYNNKLTQSIMKFFGLTVEVTATNANGQSEIFIVNKKSLVKFLERNKSHPKLKEFRQLVLLELGRAQTAQSSLQKLSITEPKITVKDLTALAKELNRLGLLENPDKILRDLKRAKIIVNYAQEKAENIVLTDSDIARIRKEIIDPALNRLAHLNLDKLNTNDKRLIELLEKLKTNPDIIAEEAEEEITVDEKDKAAIIPYSQDNTIATQDALTIKKTQDPRSDFEKILEERSVDIPEDLYDNLAEKNLSTLSDSTIKTYFNKAQKACPNLFKDKTGQRELLIAALFHPKIGLNGVKPKFEKLPLLEQVQILAVLAKRYPEYTNTEGMHSDKINHLIGHFVGNITAKVISNQEDAKESFLDILAFLQQNKDLATLQQDILDSLAKQQDQFRNLQAFHNTFVDSQALVRK